MAIDSIEKWNEFFNVARAVYLSNYPHSSTPRDVLAGNLRFAIEYADKLNLSIPDELRNTVDSLRTQGYFERVMRQAILEFYRQDTDAFEFIGRMLDLVADQFRRAWNEGMRDVGLNPKEDMTNEWEAMLQAEITRHDDYILELATAIDEGRDDTDVNQYYARIDLWSNRYNELKNIAKMECGGKEKLVWRLGRTEQHCTQCATLHGVVAFAEEWRKSGYKPQSAPNPMLECGGWRCDCSLLPTDQRRTRGGIPNV